MGYRDVRLEDVKSWVEKNRTREHYAFSAAWIAKELGANVLQVSYLCTLGVMQGELASVEIRLNKVGEPEQLAFLYTGVAAVLVDTLPRKTVDQLLASGKLAQSEGKQAWRSIKRPAGTQGSAARLVSTVGGVQ